MLAMLAAQSTVKLAINGVAARQRMGVTDSRRSTR